MNFSITGSQECAWWVNGGLDTAKRPRELWDRPTKPLRVSPMIVADDERRPFSPKSLAEHWECSERHVRNLIARGEIRAFRLGGKLLRIAWDEVDRFEREGGSK